MNYEFSFYPAIKNVGEEMFISASSSSEIVLNKPNRYLYRVIIVDLRSDNVEILEPFISENEERAKLYAAMMSDTVAPDSLEYFDFIVECLGQVRNKVVVNE